MCQLVRVIEHWLGIKVRATESQKNQKEKLEGVGAGVKCTDNVNFKSEFGIRFRLTEEYDKESKKIFVTTIEEE